MSTFLHGVRATIGTVILLVPLAMGFAALGLAWLGERLSDLICRFILWSWR